MSDIILEAEVKSISPRRAMATALLQTATEAVLLKSEALAPHKRRMKFAKLHKALADDTENELHKALVPFFKEQVKSIVDGMRRQEKSWNGLKTAGPHDYSCAMADFPEPLRSVCLQFGLTISDEELHEKGREDTPHVTVLYGLHTVDPEEVRKVLQDFQPIKIKLGKLMIFEKSGEYDVLNAEVDSPDLHRMNEAIKSLPYTSDFPEYVPHCCIAYLKPGEGEKYVGRTDLDGLECFVRSITFSTPEGMRYQIPLMGVNLSGTKAMPPAGAWGYHLLLDASHCNKDEMKNEKEIKLFIKELVEAIDMIAVGPPKISWFGKEDLAGYSVMQFIETSSITCHFMEKTGMLCLDVFSCKAFDPDIVIEMVEKHFEPKEMKHRFVYRDADHEDDLADVKGTWLRTKSVQSGPQNYTAFLDDLQILCREKNYALRTIGFVDGLPIVSVVVNPDGEKTVAVVGCVHGDEIAGAYAILEFLKTEQVPTDVRLFAIPVASPVAFVKGTRHEVVGEDPNRHFNDDSAPEDRIVLEALKAENPDFAIQLHEDSDGQGFYAYIMDRKLESLCREIIEVASQTVSVDLRKTIEGQESDGGLIYTDPENCTPGQEGNLETVLTNLGVGNICTETPMDLPLETRIGCDLAVLGFLFGRVSHGTPLQTTKSLVLAPPILDGVPDCRQDTHWTCGKEATKAVAQYFLGIGFATDEEILDALGTNEAKSTAPERIVAYLGDLGLIAVPKQHMTIQDLIQAISDGKLVIICCQDYKGVRSAKAVWEYGHYLVIIGVQPAIDEDGNSTWVIVCQDSSIENLEGLPGGTVPASQADDEGALEDHGRVLIRWSDFDENWHDIGEPKPDGSPGTVYDHFGIVVGLPLGGVKGGPGSGRHPGYSNQYQQNIVVSQRRARRLATAVRATHPDKENPARIASLRATDGSIEAAKTGTGEAHRIAALRHSTAAREQDKAGHAELATEHRSMYALHANLAAEADKNPLAGKPLAQQADEIIRNPKILESVGSHRHSFHGSNEELADIFGIEFAKSVGSRHVSSQATKLVADVFDPNEWHSRLKACLLPVMAVASLKTVKAELLAHGVVLKKNEKSISGTKATVNELDEYTEYGPSRATEWLDDEDEALDRLEELVEQSGISGFKIATEIPEQIKKRIASALRESFSQDYWTNISETTAGNAELILDRGLQEGHSIREMAGDLQNELGGDHYADVRARNIARTEAGGALNAARKGMYDDLDDETDGKLNIQTSWLSVLGPTTRDTHAELDGVPADEDGMWNLAGIDVPYPGHFSLPPEERCNCQCSVVREMGMDEDEAKGLIQDYYDRLMAGDEEGEASHRPWWMKTLRPFACPNCWSIGVRTADNRCQMCGVKSFEDHEGRPGQRGGSIARGAGRHPEVPDLLTQARSGDKDSRDKLISIAHEYMSKIAHHKLDRGGTLGSKLDPDDLAQDAVLQVHKDLDSFKGNTDAEFYAWSKEVLKHQLGHTTRKFSTGKRDVSREQSISSREDEAHSGMEPVDRTPSPSAHMEEQEEHSMLHRMIAKLPERDQQIVKLRELEGLPFEEVAKKTGIPLENIRMYHKRAVEKLQKIGREKSVLFLFLKGGATSGNFGHGGRPGHRGGSAPRAEGPEAPGTKRGDVFGHPAAAIVRWMGAHGYSEWEAKRVLAHFAISGITRSIIADHLARGKEGRGKPAPLTGEQADTIASITGKAPVTGGTSPAPEPRLAPKPIDTSDADKPMDVSGWKQIGPAEGSNPGGLFQAPDGQKYYCKFPKTEAHARNEVLASKLYQAAGAGVVDSNLITKDGKLGVASKFIEGLKYLDDEHLKSAQMDFATHAWLANWDAIGTGGRDNTKLLAGKAICVDTGGALEFRAKGGEKGSAFGNEVTEWNTMRDPYKNPQAAEVFKGIDPERLAISAKAVTDVKPETIRELVNKYHGGSLIDRMMLIDKLILRKDDIKNKAANEIEESKPRPVVVRPVTPVGPDGFVLPSPRSEAIAKVDGKQKSELEEMAKKEHISVDAMRAKIDSHLKDICDRAKMYRRTHAHDFVKVLKDGRFKSQFEVGKSDGSYDPTCRASAESFLFGYPSGVSGLDKTQRPIYGYISEKEPTDSYSSSAGCHGGARSYGDIVTEFDDSYRHHATITFCDSLGPGESGRAVGSSLLQPSIRSAEGHDISDVASSKSVDRSYFYTECQYHGQLPTTAIKCVHIPKEDNETRRKIKKMLDERGIPWKLMKE